MPFSSQSKKTASNQSASAASSLSFLSFGELHLVLPGGRGAAELDEGGVVAVAVGGVGLGEEGDDGRVDAVLDEVQHGEALLLA